MSQNENDAGPQKADPPAAEIEICDDPYGLGTVSETQRDAARDHEYTPELAGMKEDAPGDDIIGMLSLREVGSHLDELRRRLILSLLIFAPLFAIGIALYRPLWRIVILPLERAAPHLLRFQALGPSDGLVMAMRIAFAFALFLSLPVWLGQLWGFVAPGLRAREKRWLYLSLGAGGVLFLCGASLAYFIGIPLALEFLLPFNQSLDGWENAFTGRDYVNFIVTCCAGFGLAFELPLVMLAMGWFGLLTPEAIKAHWRPIVLIFFFLAALITPPDPFTQLLLAVPMLVLFGVGYWLVKWTHRE